MTGRSAKSLFKPPAGEVLEADVSRG
jgi:hypothetical protein